MRILEEFWYGNIEPTEYDTSSKPANKKSSSKAGLTKENVAGSR